MGRKIEKPTLVDWAVNAGLVIWAALSTVYGEPAWAAVALGAAAIAFGLDSWRLTQYHRFSGLYSTE